jgi:5-methylcytosine-specific restriction endonuclease McrA
MTQKKQKIKTPKQIEKEKDMDFSDIIKIRDGHKCVICGRSDHLNTHHIIPRENRATRHDLMNGITLCVLHHKFSLEISPHKNAFEFFLWLKKNRPEQFNYLLPFCVYS